MESPVVVDKPPEYHSANNERGFPFDEEEGSGAWSELASRHPDIAARLRQRPATWARKRRPSSQDATEDFGDNFGGFDRFPFDDLPPEFREHFPSHWNRNGRFSSREEPQATSPQAQSPPQQTTATQTEHHPGPSYEEEPTSIPQYGLRNTVDLGQKSPADPSLVDGEDRTQRSMSAPPDNRTNNQNRMSGQSPQEHHSPQQEHGSNVRHIPIFVEGRDEPVINKNVDHGTTFGESKQGFDPSPQPHIDREQYFADDAPHSFHHPPNFSRSFGTPFNKGFRKGSQPFTQQKMYPQNAFARGASPQRSQSPKAQMKPEEQFVKVPVHHEQTATSPSRPQPKQPSPQKTTTPPPQPPQPSANDPITLILSIQTDVLNLMTDVENFTGSKKDKKYLYLDEMLTRNLIKLDNVETEGKENIRLARKEAIKCIQKCIAVLEAKAEKGNATPQPQDFDMQINENEKSVEQKTVQNGDVEMKEQVTEDTTNNTQDTIKTETSNSDVNKIEIGTVKPEDIKLNNENVEDNAESVPHIHDEVKHECDSNKSQTDVKVDALEVEVDAKPDDAKPKSETTEIKEKNEKKSPKKKKDREGSKKDKVTEECKGSLEGETSVSNKESVNKVETMEEGKGEPQAMEVDAAAGASQ